MDVNARGPGPATAYIFTIIGDGPDGTGAITNSGGTVFSATPVKNLVLTGDASIGGNGQRFDIGSGGTVMGNGHNADAPDTVTVTIPKDGAEERFVRLRVVVDQ